MTSARRLADRAVSSLAFASRRVTTPLAVIEAVAIESEIRALLADLGRHRPDNLEQFGFKVFSQVDEDGILQAIFQRIGTKSRTFIEIGCGDGLENNTHFLALSGWRGAWIDADAGNISRINAALPPSDRLLIRQELVTRDNIDELVQGLASSLGVDPDDLDLVSMDIDGNDLHVIERLRSRPRALVVEYNGRYPPPTQVTVSYDANHRWHGDDYMGASLAAFVEILKDRSYRLVACSIGGANAFFVREDQLGDLAAPSIETVYQPARPYLIYRRAGHRPTYRFLANELDRPPRSSAPPVV